MADEILKRDQNRIVVLAGITDDANEEIKMFRVDPTTKRLLISATGTGVTGSGTDNTIPLWNGTTALDDSILTQSGSTSIVLANSTSFNPGGTASTLGSTSARWTSHHFKIELYNSTGTNMGEMVGGTSGGGYFGIDVASGLLLDIATDFVSIRSETTNSGYLNFQSAGGYTVGSSGFGFRNNAGTMEFKNSGGSWAAIT